MAGQLRRRFPEIALTVVAGRNRELYWRQFTGEIELPSEDGIRMLDFIRDVRPLYVESNLVIVPTTVSAGTNLKVLEAMAMERAIVSTTCGCAGLGLDHGASLWIADDAAGFIDGVAQLLQAPSERARLARAARAPSASEAELRLEAARPQAARALSRTYAAEGGERGLRNRALR